MFAHSREPHPAIKLWCQVPFTKSKTIVQIEMYCMQCFLKSKYIKRRTFNDKNRWIIKKIMVLKKLLPHLATRGTYCPGDWRFGEAWREPTLVYPPVMCQQRLIYCTWEFNVIQCLNFEFHTICGNVWNRAMCIVIYCHVSQLQFRLGSFLCLAWTSVLTWGVIDATSKWPRMSSKQILNNNTCCHSISFGWMSRS